MRDIDFKAPISIRDIHAPSVQVQWTQPTIGFGHFCFSVVDGRVRAETENMSRDWLRRALHALADKIADEAEIIP